MPELPEVETIARTLDPLVRGELLGKEFAYHVLSTTGDPMIHCSRARRPEIVVFGHGLQMKPPAFLFAGDEILVKAVTVLIIAAGYAAGQVALAQSLVITLIVIEVVVMTVAIGVVVGIHRHNDSLNAMKIRTLKG
jgi:NADH:ubiquinone oxidoreductase subunit K